MFNNLRSLRFVMFNKNPLIDESIENLRPLDVTALKGCVTDFDLFLDIAGKPVLYARGYYEWSPAEIEKLNHDGFSVLFYEKVNHDKVNHLRSARPMEVGSMIMEYQDGDTKIVDEIIDGYRVWLEKIGLQGELQTKALAVTEHLENTITMDSRIVKGFIELSQHDSYSFYHSIRTAAYGAAITLEMGSTTDEQHLLDLVYGCLLHDLGHVKIDPAILEKQGSLTASEWAEIRQHSRYGIEILEDIPLSKITAEIILHHHEREDGEGYPHALKGKELIQEVRVVAFCDVFDALTSPRPYQKQMAFEDAFEFIEKNLLEFVDNKSFQALARIYRKANIKAIV